MHRCSSASRTCRASLSTSEWTATLRMPSSLQARMTRTAISLRLATRIFLNTHQPFRGRLGRRRVGRSGGAPGSGNGHGHLERRGRRGCAFAPQPDSEPIALDLEVADARILEHRDQVLQECGIHQGVRTRLGLRRGGLPGGFGGVAFHQARSTYSRVRVSTLTITPSSRYSGTLTVAPLSRIADFEPPEAVSPRTPGSVF